MSLKTSTIEFSMELEDLCRARKIIDENTGEVAYPVGYCSRCDDIVDLKNRIIDTLDCSPYCLLICSKCGLERPNSPGSTYPISNLYITTVEAPLKLKKKWVKMRGPKGQKKIWEKRVEDFLSRLKEERLALQKLYQDAALKLLEVDS